MGIHLMKMEENEGILSYIEILIFQPIKNQGTQSPVKIIDFIYLGRTVCVIICSLLFLV